MFYKAKNPFSKPLDMSVLQGLFDDVTTFNNQMKKETCISKVEVKKKFLNT